MKELHLIIWYSLSGIRIDKTFDYHQHILNCKTLKELEIPYQTSVVKMPKHILKTLE